MRYLPAVLAAVVLTCLPALATAQSQCPEGKWCVDKETAVKVRDKARGFELLCSQLDTLPDLPTRLEALCEEPGGANRIWAKAETAQEAQETADELQRKLNVTKGRLSEVRGRAGKVAPLQRKLGAARSKLGKWYRSPWTVVGAALVAGGAGFVVGVVAK